ncbi:hypothetical protein M8A51_18665 [Schlegelella sp. S2-27]|uniref:Uncharacterized protein n=1 Tax=Caldimonas mangrovi TaxID=2944811 RepID=A0ABT0YSD6_9BURK|nr:hypothetical protein [Caldimonas mangrovi]MCM5681553.1 hypothetical protein [Caldimonas mangrovi]
MPVIGNERIANGPHPFWLATCDIDTHARGSNNARNDTPWAAFTADGKRLVCTIWNDLVADILDPLTGQVRRFVVIGGRSNYWKGGAVKRGRECLERLQKARGEQLPVYAFEVSASGEAQLKVSRSIHRVYMDRVHLLKQHFGLEVDALKARLGIIEAIADRWKSPDIDALHSGMLFELVPARGDIPGAGWVPDGHRGPQRDEDAAEPGGALHWAQLALPILVDHVRRQTDDELLPLTYEQLAERLGRVNRHGHAWARGLGYPLGMVTRLIEAATADWPEAEKPPYLTTVVVSKSGTDAGLPDTGIKDRWPWFNELTREEKRARVRDEYRRIMAYGDRWLDVLNMARLAPVTDVEPPKGEGQEEVDGHGGWGGGESPEHLVLKQYALAHPELFDAPTEFAQAEYPLLSGDVVDVFFRDMSAWTGVEVKSIKSADDDLERGIFQVVKYRAVLKAQAEIYSDRSPKITVLLAVQRPLPRALQRVATQLDVPWVVVTVPANP